MFRVVSGYSDLSLRWHVGSQKCRVLDNMTFWFQMLYYQGILGENLLLWCEMSLCIHNEDAKVWKNNLNWRNMLKTSQIMEFKKLHSPMMMSSPCHTIQSKKLLSSNDVCWCWELTSSLIYSWKVPCWSHLQPKIPENAPLQSLIIIGHIHMLEEAWLLVLASHPHHSPPLVVHSNLNPNGLLYPMPNPPTHLYLNASLLSHHPWLNLWCSNMQSIDQSEDSRDYYMII